MSKAVDLDIIIYYFCTVKMETKSSKHSLAQGIDYKHWKLDETFIVKD